GPAVPRARSERSGEGNAFVASGSVNGAHGATVGPAARAVVTLAGRTDPRSRPRVVPVVAGDPRGQRGTDPDRGPHRRGPAEHAVHGGVGERTPHPRAHRG